ncbi:MAG: DNA starvation/stationary phase protection protein [Alphaproteobacteria bacterium]|nr:DNA starvation/stationary phase protection protein [Alphaproteobacteria bacterium]
MSKELVHSLKIMMANTYAHLIQTQGFHWNVEGKEFFDLHGFFGDVYEVLFETIDIFAERIRALDAYPPSSLGQITAMNTMDEDHSDVRVSSKMVEIFLKNNHILVTQAKELCHLCEKHGDLVTQDLIIAFIYKLEKFAWMAHSSMK